MKLVQYDSQYRNQLRHLILDYFHEVSPATCIGDITDAGNMIDSMVEEEKDIYLVVDKGVVAGFFVVFMAGEYMMADDILYCEYMYISKEYRSGRAIVYIYNELWKIGTNNGVNISCATNHTSSNIANNLRVGGEAIATVFTFDLKSQEERVKKYSKRINNG